MNSTNTSAHTAGPWNVDKIGNQRFVLNKVGVVIAEVGGPLRSFKREQEANARLIAASPALYEACKKIVELAHRCEDDNRPIDGGAICHIAWDAIAKAEGK